MKIIDYIKSLLPNFKRDRVIEDLRITRGEIRECTLPAFESPTPLFKGWKFKSKEMKDKNAQFGRLVKSDGGGNIIGTIEKSLKAVITNLDIIEELVNKCFMEDVSGSGFTYLKANLLQLVELSGFVSKYSRKFLIYVYVLESAEFPDEGSESRDAITPYELEWINSNFLSFCTALSILNGSPDSLKKQLDDIPDIRITEENGPSLSATLGSSRIDPFNMGLIATWVNPIYHLRLMVAEHQAERYKAAKEEMSLCQLRKLNMEKLSEGKPDAAVQKQIQYMEKRIDDLNYKIIKMEKDYA
jgi:hypothetical protein